MFCIVVPCAVLSCSEVRLIALKPTFFGANAPTDALDLIC